MAEKNHICSVCKKGFDTVTAYCQHQCTTGFTPTNAEHQDALTDRQFTKISECAIERGAEHMEEETTE